MNGNKPSTLFNPAERPAALTVLPLRKEWLLEPKCRQAYLVGNGSSTLTDNVKQALPREDGAS